MMSFRSRKKTEASIVRRWYPEVSRKMTTTAPSNHSRYRDTEILGITSDCRCWEISATRSAKRLAHWQDQAKARARASVYDWTGADGKNACSTSDAIADPLNSAADASVRSAATELCRAHPLDSSICSDERIQHQYIYNHERLDECGERTENVRTDGMDHSVRCTIH